MLYTENICTISQVVLVTISRFNLKCNYECITSVLTRGSSTSLARKSIFGHMLTPANRKPSADHVSQSLKQNLKSSAAAHIAIAHYIPQVRNAK